MKLPKFLLNQKIPKSPLKKFRIHGKSMNPSFTEGSFVLVWTWFKDLREGDVVIARSQKRLIIKRIKKVKNRKYFLVGDNEKESTDSRSFGFVKKKDILGKVLFGI